MLKAFLTRLTDRGYHVVKRTADSVELHPEENKRPGWYLVVYSQKVPMHPLFETGPFRTQLLAAGYATALAGGNG